MIRVSTLGFLLLAGALCLGVFSVKHQVIALEGRWNEINRDLARDQQAIHVLRAEWSYLNDPQRLRHLAEIYLEMSPMAGNQIVGFADLPAQDDRSGSPEIAPDSGSSDLSAPAALAVHPILPLAAASTARPDVRATPVSNPAPGEAR